MVEPILAVLHRRFRAAVPDMRRLPDGVWRRTGALNTWGTNALEGNTLTRDEVERLLLEEASIPDRPVPDVLETLQHDRAFRGLTGRLRDPITLPVVLQLHETVFQGSERHRPGQWRRSNVYIAGARHRPPPWQKALPRMVAWEQAAGKRPGRHVIAWAASLHQAFEEVHPFEDGNGRIGRLLLNLSLMQRGWPPVHITPDDRGPYLAALAAGNEGEPDPLATFLEAAMVRSILDLLDQVGGEEDRLQDLKALAARPWCPHGAPYLALRCRQGALAGLRAIHTAAPPAASRRPGRPRWVTSEAALRHYLRAMGG